MSATPTIAAQGAISSAELDPQAALRANKEVFFFRLVRDLLVSLIERACDDTDFYGGIQEREIEKVNEFYIQKESEVLQTPFKFAHVMLLVGEIG